MNKIRDLTEAYETVIKRMVELGEEYCLKE